MAAPALAVASIRPGSALCRVGGSHQLRSRPCLAPPPARRLPRRPAAAPTAAVSAAQKRVFRSFREMVEQSPEPVLVQFSATWCGPCQMMSGILDEVAPSMRSRVRFVKVDTDKYPGVASQYQIGALPTLILFKGGQPVDRMEGVVMGGDLKNRLEYLCSHR